MSYLYNMIDTIILKKLKEKHLTLTSYTRLFIDRNISQKVQIQKSRDIKRNLKNLSSSVSSN